MTATRPGGRTPTSGLALLLALALMGGAPAGEAPPPDLEDLLWELQILPLEADPPPPFDLQALDGRRWSAADLRGRAAFLYFWESG